MHDAEVSLGNSLGGMLAFARESRGIPIEQAARETRIRVGRLREIEADNLDRLSPGYTRLFVLDYARYLQVPETAIRPFLPQVNAFGVQGCGYLRRASDVARKILRASKAPPRRSRVLFVACAILLLAAGGFQTWVLWKKLDRIRNSHMTSEDFRPATGPDANPARVPGASPKIREESHLVPAEGLKDAVSWPEYHDGERLASHATQSGI